MPGSTSGDMKRLSAARASFAGLRPRPSAARVASTTPNKVEKQAISSELPAVRWIWRDLLASNRASYQPSEKPLGGNLIVWPSVKEVISTMTTGATMMVTARIASPPITRP